MGNSTLAMYIHMRIPAIQGHIKCLGLLQILEAMMVVDFVHQSSEVSTHWPPLWAMLIKKTIIWTTEWHGLTIMVTSRIYLKTIYHGVMSKFSNREEAKDVFFFFAIWSRIQRTLWEINSSLGNVNHICWVLDVPFSSIRVGWYFEFLCAPYHVDLLGYDPELY